MRVEKLKIIFIWIFAIVPVSCILMELMFNTIYGIALKPGDVPKIYPFDIALTEQVNYFSVWTALLTSCWGIVNVINYFKKDKKIAWGESENVLTMVFTYNFISSLIYTASMLVARNTVVGFNSPYSITKSTLEHWIIPLMFFVYYFSLRENTRADMKTYAKKTAWKNLIIPAFYVVFVISRSVLLHQTGMVHEVPRSFPYEQVDPYNPAIKNAYARWSITIVASFACLFASYSLSVLFEAISVKSSLKVRNRFILDGKFKLKR